jgi:DNA gyrase subunit A
VSRGTNIRTLVNIPNDDSIRAIVVFDRDEKGYISMVSKRGIIKKVDVEEFKNIRSTGIIALETDEGDVLVDAIFTSGNDDIIICSANGLALRISEKTVRPMGRTARGVIGIRLEEGDSVVGLVKYNEKKDMVIVTEEGYAKRLKMNEINVKGRGGKGMIYFGVSEKTGKVVRVLPVEEENEIVIITAKGMIIRMPALNISVMGRPARGIKAINLKEGDKVVDVEVFE